MRFFDAHLHLPTPDGAGLDTFLRFLEDQQGLMGGNLILNTAAEAHFIEANLGRLPSNIQIIPYFDAGVRHHESIRRSGWYKVHPSLQRFDIAAIPGLVSALKQERPKGVIVHCFPWGPELRFNISLHLVIGLAQELPDTIVLVTHGGGYESWAFRAHVGALKNVHFDFSMTLDYYRGADAVKPLQRYLCHSPSRLHFGSDWPSGNVERQLEEMLRLAREVGFEESDLERLLLDNAHKSWPGAFKLESRMESPDA